MIDNKRFEELSESELLEYLSSIDALPKEFPNLTDEEIELEYKKACLGEFDF